MVLPEVNGKPYQVWEMMGIILKADEGSHVVICDKTDQGEAEKQLSNSSIYKDLQCK